MFATAFQTLVMKIGRKYYVVDWKLLAWSLISDFVSFMIDVTLIADGRGVPPEYRVGANPIIPGARTSVKETRFITAFKY